MATYKDSGVDVSLGDKCSSIAYQHAQATFSARDGLFGTPVVLAEGFAGVIDMGEFYMTTSDDGVGTKILIAEAMQRWDTMAYDLLAMVLDDSVCLGAEIVTAGNSLDVPKVDEAMVEGLMAGLEKAAKEQKVAVMGGEIAELGDCMRSPVWNANAVGVLEKHKLLDPVKVQAGDVLLGLQSGVFRSNGISLVRHILSEKFGENWVNEPFGDTTWGEIALTPSVIYHNCILDMIGRYGEAPKVEVHGIAHITGGGIPSKLKRILKRNNLGAVLDNLFDPHPAILELQKMGDVSDAEAYKSWNMGTGMILALPAEEADKAYAIAKEHGINAQKVGEVVKEPDMQIVSKGAMSAGQTV